ncbi:MAG: substrate-binding domain-containing protein, partial [Steroidobacteraceae bacterium]
MPTSDPREFSWLKISLVAAALLTLGAFRAHAQASGPPTNQWSPPWQHGANNDAVDRGLEFTEPDADNLADFHGSPLHPKLVLYVGGNYFFAMAPLVQTFEELHPEYKARIYWETIPPGLLMRQLKAGGTVTVGNMTWTVKPDVYLAGLQKVKEFVADGTLEAPAVPYVTNTLAIMVAKGNPWHIAKLAHLADPRIKLALPNPEFEGIATQIKDALSKAGGAQLVEQVYENKVKDGSAVLTHIHHRQTPLWIMRGQSDAGITWQSEAVFQEQAGHPIGHVDIPPSENSTAIYGGAVVKGAAHPKAGRQWLDFITSAQGLAIFERYGFK